MKLPSDVVVGQCLQLIALHIAAAIAATYALGYRLGHYVHTMNDTLTSLINQLKDARYLSTEWWGIVNLLEELNAEKQGMVTAQRR